MALNRIRIGDVISVVDEKNKDDFDYPFFGININKEFMPSVANTSKVDRRKYKIICKNRFVFSGMQRLMLFQKLFVSAYENAVL